MGHPVAPDKLAFAVGAKNSTFSDHGMRWDNSGKNGHYAPIRWSNHAYRQIVGCFPKWEGLCAALFRGSPSLHSYNPR